MNLVLLLFTIYLSHTQSQTTRTLVFRLDDLQCGWLTEQGLDIIQIFMENKVPLTVGIVTEAGVDCMSDQLKYFYTTYPNLLEIASHSVTHPQLVNMNLSQQIYEVNESKNAIESFLGAGTVRTFIPPFNEWNYDTVTACTQCGYDIISPECTIADIDQPVDYQCTSNMYTNRPAFFPRIDGLTHVPIGAAISSFWNENALLSYQQLFNGTIEDCYNGNCSVSTQEIAMYPLTDSNDPDQVWANIMMHPDCFPEDATMDDLNNYFLPLFQLVQTPDWKLKNIEQLVGPIGSRPAVNGTRPSTR